MRNSTPPDTSSAADSANHTRRGRGRPPRRGDATPSDCGTTETILRVARELFMQRGYAGVAVGEVAAAAGVTKPTLYYHFGDKEGLYTAVISAMLAEVGSAIREVTQTQDPVRDRLFHLACGYFIHADYTMEPMLRDVTQLVGAASSTHIRQVYERECFAPIERLMADGIARHEVRPSPGAHLLAQAYLALLEAFTATGGHLTRTPAEHAEVAQAVVALFWCGAGGDQDAGGVLSS